MLNDDEAEHLPGCNLAIRKSALDAIGGFNPVFRTAGDDVDVCWRLRDAGGKLRFIPAAMVWHHRRFTVKAYFQQQAGYGLAEAQLMKEHPQRFGPIGGARWRGAIYGDSLGPFEPGEGRIFHGPFGSGAFQVIYANGGFAWRHWLSGVLWIVLAFFFFVLRMPWMSLVMIGSASWFAWRRMTFVPRDFKDAVLLWTLCLLQPVRRELARLEGMLELKARPSFKPQLPDILPPRRPRKWSFRIMELRFWSDIGVDREQWLTAFRSVLQNQGIPFREDDGWRWFDLELNPTRWISRSIVTVTEYHGGQRMLTRVGVQQRVRWALLGTLGALLASVPLIISMEHPWPRRIIAVAVQLGIVWIVGGWVFFEKRLRAFIIEAATRSGMVEMPPDQQRL